MNTSTWGRSVQVNRLDVRQASGAQARDWDGDDSQLERWHASHLGNACYLAIFMAVAIFTVFAFIPVWLVLQAQRATVFVGKSWARLRGAAQGHA